MFRWLTAHAERARANEVFSRESKTHTAARVEVRQLFDAAEELSYSAERQLARAALHRAAVTAGCQVLGEGLPRDVEDARVACTNPDASIESLRAGHEAVLAVLERDWQAVRAARQRMLFRVGVLLILAVLLLWGVSRPLSRLLKPKNLAEGAPWIASSKAHECHPDENECGGSPARIFFHTNHEPNPWLRIDLLAPARFSSLTIVNRQDVAQDRAVPLIVEVGDDGSTFRQVARRDELFTTWEPRFEPTTARYVRLRVDKHSALHLEAVEVHP